MSGDSSNRTGSDSAAATTPAKSGTLIRVLTALVLIPIVLALVLWAPEALFAAVLALVAWLTLREYLELADKAGQAPLRYFSWIAVVALVAWLAAAALVAWPAAAALVLLAPLTLALALWPSRPLASSLPGAAASLLGVFYVGLPLGLLGALRRLPNGPGWVIYVLVLVWLSDTAAYFVGRALGRHKLAPRISPAKTWEGAAGSLAAAVAFGLAFPAYFLPRPPPTLAWSLLTAAAVNIAGQMGDLVESALKRSAGVKDSSTLLPGHGGLLDRLDALLFAVPVLWYILAWRSGHFFAPL